MERAVSEWDCCSLKTDGTMVLVTNVLVSWFDKFTVKIKLNDWWQSLYCWKFNDNKQDLGSLERLWLVPCGPDCQWYMQVPCLTCSNFPVYCLWIRNISFYTYTIQSFIRYMSRPQVVSPTPQLKLQWTTRNYTSSSWQLNATNAFQNWTFTDTLVTYHGYWWKVQLLKCRSITKLTLSKSKVFCFLWNFTCSRPYPRSSPMISKQGRTFRLKVSAIAGLMCELLSAKSMI